MTRKFQAATFDGISCALTALLLSGCVSPEATTPSASDLAETPQASSYEFPFQDPSLSPHERAVDLVSRMTLEEKAAQMYDKAAAIPRLGIHEYNW
ncbi:MAG TPA: hypothetical protein P5341_05340 [Hyphomonas sp.]|nr:hypothetical protein [Hyphomonas sp.]